MSAALQVLAPGFGVSVQDMGRTGWRSQGVPVSGALDPWLLSATNALVGNEAGAAALEIGLDGPTLCAVGAPVTLALCGDASASCNGPDLPTRPRAAWQSFTLQAGEQVKVTGARTGVAYLAVAGGLDVPVVLGSRSTTTRARLGGHQGRTLQAGDLLPCHASADCRVRQATAPWPEAGPSIRVMAGPQLDHFTEDSMAQFTQTDWTVGHDMDRMGLRLQGCVLEHREGRGQIVSDAVAPGSIQVPPNGQPIVLMPDCQTTGGYPKLAQVIRADLHKLALARPGHVFRFAEVDAPTARRALFERQQAHVTWLASITEHTQHDTPDGQALYEANLISGAVWDVD